MPLTTARPAAALAAGILALSVGLSGVVPAAALPASTLATTTPTPISVIVPITAPVSTTGLIPAEDLARYTDQFGPLTRQLDAVAGTSAVLAVDPMILASIRVLGRSAPESAVAWLDRLSTLPNESFALAYGDADVVIAARTQTLDALVPSGFGFALDAADFAETPTEEPSETPSPDATDAPDADAAPPFPTTADLLAWPSSLPRIAWPAGGDLGADDVQPLATAGYGAVIVNSANVSGERGPIASIDGLTGIVANAELSASLLAAASAVSEPERVTALATLREVVGHAASERGFVIALDRRQPSTFPGLRDALDLVDDLPSAELVPLADLLTSRAVPSAKLGAGPDTEEREAVVSALTVAASRERAFSSVLVDRSQLLDPRRLERIALYSTGWIDDRAAWLLATEAFTERSTEILGSVRIERGNDVVLLARNTDLRVAVSNALPYPVKVRVSVHPQRPLLQVEGDVELTVEPESTGAAQVPVEAVTNGDVAVRVTVTSPTGVSIDTGFTRLTLQAEWEGIGTGIVVALLALVFGAGLVRVFIRRRTVGDADGAAAAEERATGGADD